MSKIEIINDKDISKYLKLMFDSRQAHRPDYLGIQLVDIDEATGNVSTTNLSNNFSRETADLLNTHLSLLNFFTEIGSYKTYLTITK